MDRRTVLSVLMLSMMVCLSSSNFAEDQKQCKNQLLSLSPCIAFVSGDAKAPPPSCCAELSKNTDKSKLCLCILIKDRNEPGLGFKLNATLALSLPSICHVPEIAAQCPELLKLAPNSTEAQIFEEFDSAQSFGNSTTTSADNIPSSSSKFGVKGIRHAAVIGVFVWILFFLVINKVQKLHFNEKETTW